MPCFKERLRKMLKLLKRFLLKYSDSPKNIPETDALKMRIIELESVIKKVSLDISETLKNTLGQSCDIHIDRVEIEKVNLEQLVFNIDDLGVKDLSGSLSIGVNYGDRVVRMSRITPTTKKEKRKSVFPGKNGPEINILYGHREGD